MTTPSLYTQFTGGWCDNCRTAFSFIPADGNCPECGPVKLRRATVTVEFPDDDETVRAYRAGVARMAGEAVAE